MFQTSNEEEQSNVAGLKKKYGKNGDRTYYFPITIRSLIDLQEFYYKNGIAIDLLFTFLLKHTKISRDIDSAAQPKNKSKQKWYRTNFAISQIVTGFGRFDLFVYTMNIFSNNINKEKFNEIKNSIRMFTQI